MFVFMQKTLCFMVMRFHKKWYFRYNWGLLATWFEVSVLFVKKFNVEFATGLDESSLELLERFLSSPIHVCHKDSKCVPFAVEFEVSVFHPC